MTSSTQHLIIVNLVGDYILDHFKIPRTYMPIISTLLLSVKLDSNYIIIPLTILVISYCSYNYYEKHKKTNVKIVEEEETTYFETYFKQDHNIINEYMKKFPQFFENEYNVKITEQGEKKLVPGERIKFNDDNFNVKGFVSSDTIEKKGDKKDDNVYEEDYYTLHVYKSSKIQAIDYYNKICDKLDEKDEKILYFKKIINMDSVVTKYYEGPKNIFSEDSVYMKTFFSEHKRYLINLIDKVANHEEFFKSIGQTNYINLILYGPPGTGKSSFVSRLGKSINRHIISVNVSEHSKAQNYINVQTPHLMCKMLESNEFIILLEEFDTAIKSLTEQKMNRIENKTNDGSAMQIEDLLELLQGSVVPSGQIIIATTNKLDEIKELCPALFRPGRLTPVEFGYLKAKEINELGNLYFGSKYEGITFNPNIPTSELIEIATYAKIIDDVSYFNTKVNENRKK